MIATIMLISTMAISTTLAGIVAELWAMEDRRYAAQSAIVRVMSFLYCGHHKDRQWSYADSRGPIVARVYRQFQTGVTA